LTKITGQQAFQGVSGKIAFGRDGDPQDKAVVLLNVNAQGQAKLVLAQGTFQ
jgi:ABC-type branched-subunit amino acid transport system substrate-binding protein